MSRLNDYQTALLATRSSVTGGDLERVLDERGAEFVSFVVDHGLGPVWHTRTSRPEFQSSRLAAEALFLAQVNALGDVDSALTTAGISYVAMKGAANRVVLYDNPSIRACHDLDLLVHSDDRVRAAQVLVENGFSALPEANSIGRELVLTRGDVDLDLHWALLREGRLRLDITGDLLSRRQRSNGFYVLSSEDTLFTLLVHPAITKHLAGYVMGLHRVMDIVTWLETQSFDWEAVSRQLKDNGVRSAAWATLRWVQLLEDARPIPRLSELMMDLQPSRPRRAWIDFWLRNNLSERVSGAHWARLVGFSPFLHDSLRDVVRAFEGRFREYRRSDADLAAFDELVDE